MTSGSVHAICLQHKPLPLSASKYSNFDTNISYVFLIKKKKQLLWMTEVEQAWAGERRRALTNTHTHKWRNLRVTDYFLSRLFCIFFSDCVCVCLCYLARTQGQRWLWVSEGGGGWWMCERLNGWMLWLMGRGICSWKLKKQRIFGGADPDVSVSRKVDMKFMLIMFSLYRV